jgi:tRNA threonylcarbamoyladenosine biosynthesis protein TsaE
MSAIPQLANPQASAQSFTDMPKLETFIPQGSRTVLLNDDLATRRLGAQIARAAKPGWIVTLSGGLGAGKTTLVQGLLAAMGERGRVRSPTYTLVESYTPGQVCVHHLDLYRLNSPQEWLDAGLDELVDGRSIILIEWPEQGGQWVPAPDLTIGLDIWNTGRRAMLTACSAQGATGLETIDPAPEPEPHP